MKPEQELKVFLLFVVMMLTTIQKMWAFARAIKEKKKYQAK
jgi:hypothetical protein